MMIARVFPERTNATPEDEYAFIGYPPLPIFVPDDITEVHVSVTFTWHLSFAEKLANAWRHIAPVKIGGPATGISGGEFTPGMYLKPGYVITSRGCPNSCYFCLVPKREGSLRELQIKNGNNVLDDNLLACSDEHIKQVFSMLKKNKNSDSRPVFTGGLEAKRLKSWHIELLQELRPKRLYFAYDTPDDFSPLENAADMFLKAGYGSRNIIYCYVLIGFEGDTFKKADDRLKQVVKLNMCPMAMLYRDYDGKTTKEWQQFQRMWVRPALIYTKNRK